MNKSIEIWNRKFNLPITFDCYENEEILDTQLDAIKEFKISEEMQEKSKEAIIKQIKKNTESESEIDNVFKYVRPMEIYVSRHKKKKIVGLMCVYKLDMEHGLAIVFENNKFVKIGEQDILY